MCLATSLGHPVASMSTPWLTPRRLTPPEARVTLGSVLFFMHKVAWRGDILSCPNPNSYIETLGNYFAASVSIYLGEKNTVLADGYTLNEMTFKWMPPGLGTDDLERHLAGYDFSVKSLNGTMCLCVKCTPRKSWSSCPQSLTLQDPPVERSITHY